MKISETIFDKCLIIEPSIREDNRGTMSVFYEPDMKEVMSGFEVREQRLYKMPKANTFFGIHYQNRGKAQGKLITVIQGRGLDYIVDLRKDSTTYRQYKSFELDGNNPRLVFIPAGFGHGFLSLEDNTIQAFAIDVDFEDEHSGVINHRDPGLGIVLPVENYILSDYDADAPFCD